MNVARGGGSGRSGSFKNTVDYVMHDKDGQTQDRVGAVEMHNLAGHEPERSWREMRTTCEAASAVKTRNGVQATGRKNDNPVFHYALSWHPDDKAKEAEKKSAFDDCKKERGKVFKTHKIDRVPPQPSPALDVKQRDRHKLHEWMELARGMLQAGMFQKRHPLRKEFGRSLSKMAEPVKERKVDLSRKFRLIDERKDVMLPMRHTKAAKRYAQPHIDARSRPHQQKVERQAALIRVEADYENKLFDLDKKHGQQMGREKLENLNFKKEVHRAWADFKEQHQVKERKNEWEEKRDAYKEAFNKAADDRTQVKTELTDKQWQRGTVGDFSYHAKILAEPSQYGIGTGRIIKLELQDAQGRQVLNYDHGWDARPETSKPEHGAVEAIVQHYEQVREVPTVEASDIKSNEITSHEIEHREWSEPEIEMGY